MSTSQNKASNSHGIAGLAFIEAEYALVYSQAQTEGKADKLDPDTRAALESALAYLEQFRRPAKLGCLICQRDISGSGDRTRVPSGEIVVVVPRDRGCGAIRSDRGRKAFWRPVQRRAQASDREGSRGLGGDRTTHGNSAHPHRAGKGVSRP
jgi:hypothetical protein